jgi:hypothetical protein
MGGSSGPTRWLLSGLLAARPFCSWVESGPEQEEIIHGKQRRIFAGRRGHG